MEVKRRRGGNKIVRKWDEKSRGGKLWCRNGNKSSEGLVALSQWWGSVRGAATPWAPCLFNHVQLHSRSPSCREITSSVMATKPSRPQHIGNRLKPTHTQRHSAPTPDLLSNNLFDTSAVLVLGRPWIMEISVITTSGRSQHFPPHTLGMWIQFIWALI